MKYLLPHGVKLRDYQQQAWDAFFEQKKLHNLLIWHRRAGKSKFAMNVIAAASQIKVGAYYFLFPRLTQARRVIWEGRGEDGFRFLDHFPSSIIHKVNNTDLKIEFKNGSIFRLLGTDNLNYDSLMGGNPLGILYDEFAMQNPVARDYLIPIIAENGGWELIISTPRGTNHLHDLYQHVYDKDDWYVNKLTIDDTRRANGLPVVDKDTIEELKLGGWSDDKVDQEFYCSFTASVRGAYFAQQLREAEDAGHISDWGVDNSFTVNTYWDLGHHDATSIWLVQRIYDEFHFIAYYENNNEPISHYINWLRDYRDRNGLVYDMHFGPHDVTNRHVATGQSVQDVARELGFNFQRVPRVGQKDDAINSARMLLPRCKFHKTNCKQGLSCLREYHKAYNESMQTYSSHPVHNWASHGADAFLTFAQSANITSNPYLNVETNRILADFA